MKFAITDIETTGSYASGHSITEICVAIHDGTTVLDEFHTLLNPGVSIPAAITALTGIDNSMLQGAPKFDEIAAELHDFIGDAVFVAHNVSFDYSFIKAGFDELGMKWNPKRLCTVKLARKAFPGYRSYSLGNITRDLGIVNERAHRAYGDVKATSELFSKCVEVLGIETCRIMLSAGSGEAFLPAHIDRAGYDRLPESPGVYYFLNEKGKPIYIGKANNIKKRVRSHFSGNLTSKKLQDFIRDIRHIEFRETATELIALLFEDAEIRKHWPIHNKAQKQRPDKFGIVQYFDQRGFIRLNVNPVKGNMSAVRSFPTPTEAKAWIVSLAKSYNLDYRLLGLDGIDSNSVLPDVNEHNNRLMRALEASGDLDQTLVLEGKGRTRDERSFVYVDRGRIIGFGFTPIDVPIANTEELDRYMERIPHTDVSAAVLRSFLKDNREMRMIQLPGTLSNTENNE